MALPEMTLAELRTAVRQRADMVNSQFVSDAELSQYVNESLFSLYDLLVTTYGEDYYVSEADATTDGTQLVALPADFYKLLGVDLVVDGANRVTLRQFTRMERNRASFTGANGFPWYNIRYRLRAGKLWLTPTPSSGQSLKILYVPRLTPLEESLTITLSGVAAGDSVEFEDSGEIVAGTDFVVGADDTVTAENLAAELNDVSDSLGVAGFTATASGAVVTVVRDDDAQSTGLGFKQVSSSLAVAGGVLSGGYRQPPTDAQTYSDGISGWLEYAILDAAIKCLQKEESDTRVLFGQRERLIQRINDSAPNRDAAEPARVADVTRTGGWGDDNFGGFGFPWWED